MKGRPRKQTVDYFPHFTKHKRTMDIIERRFGVHGYAFWFKLLEILGSTDGHAFDLNDVDNWEYLTAKSFVDDETARAILDKLATLGAIDNDLYKMGIVWCQNFVDLLAPLYAKRVEEMPLRPISDTGKSISDTGKQQRKGKDRIVKDKKIDDVRRHNGLYEEVIAYLNTVCNKSFRPHSDATVKLINGRVDDGYTVADIKRVIDAKAKDWLGDAKMDRFLRPSTLFNKTKFEDYLNEAPSSSRAVSFNIPEEYLQ